MSDTTSKDKTILPARAFKYLGIWRKTIPQVEPKPYFWDSFYHKLVNDDDTDLTTKEKLVLDILLTAKPITRNNLRQFVIDFDKIEVQDTISTKLSELYYRFKDNKFTQKFSQVVDNENDAWLLQDRVTRFELSEGLYEKLERFDFSSADKVVADNSDAINQQMYLKMKASYFAKYYESKFLLNTLPFLLDKNQAGALLSEARHTLVQGRAATGKTQLLLAKLIYLNEQLKFKPEEVLLCAFDEILLDNLKYLGTQALTLKENNKQVYKKYPATLCSELLKHTLTSKEQLMPEKDKDVFIEALLESLWANDVDFREKLYEFLKTTDSNVDKQALKNLDAYYEYYRNLRFTSLRGERLSSIGEKWMADFLFEHGINYVAEPEYDLTAIKTEDEKLIKFIKANQSLDADFYLPDNRAILEYWAIDLNEKDIAQKIDFDKMFGMPWLTYKSLMQEKQGFWKDMRSVILNPDDEAVKHLAEVTALLELSLIDLRAGKEYFEQQLTEKIASIGIKVKLVGKEKLYTEVWKIHKNYLVRLFRSFIDRFQHGAHDITVFNDKVTTYKDNSRVHTFLDLAKQVLTIYEEQLRLPIKKRLKALQALPAYTVDNNQTIQRLIENTNDDKLIKQSKLIKWVLIEGYQDFSPLWQQVITKILEVNINANIFAVGDSWQACKQDAGSCISMLDTFLTNYEGAATLPLITNYRSNRKLVVAGNHFMQNNKFRGGTALVNNLNNDVSVFVADILAAEGKKRLAKYLNKVVEIIQENPSVTYLLVHPFTSNGDFFIAEFYNILTTKLVDLKVYKGIAEVRQSVFADYPENLAGVEINTVIMLEMIQDVYPAVSLDNELFDVFGENIIQAEEKQHKQFYLAITRAQERLWILTESGKESAYIDSLI